MIPKMSAPKRGRKPLQDKMKMVRIFLRESQIKEMGGTEKTQSFIYKKLKKKP